ncbi:MAG: hypothetical protein NTW51_00125 [Cyanobacteria bacterium]|nr:hypothetical protein [Cyanobacteriota bacterium]
MCSSLRSLLGGGGPQRQPRSPAQGSGAAGVAFESLVIRDLRVLAQALDGEVFHYRDDYGVPADGIALVPVGALGP